MPLEWGGNSGDYSVPSVPSVVRSKPVVRKPDGDRRRPESTTPSRPSTAPPSEPEPQASPEQRGEETNIRNVMAVEHLMAGLKRIHDMCEREYGGQLNRVRTTHPPSEPPLPARQERPASYMEPERVEPPPETAPPRREPPAVVPKSVWNPDGVPAMSPNDLDSAKWGALLLRVVKSNADPDGLRGHIRGMINRAVFIARHLQIFVENVRLDFRSALVERGGRFPPDIIAVQGLFDAYERESTPLISILVKTFNLPEWEQMYFLVANLMSEVANLVNGVTPYDRAIEGFAKMHNIAVSLQRLKVHSNALVNCFVREHNIATSRTIVFVSSREGDIAFSEFRERIIDLLVQCLNDWRRPSSGEPLEPAGDGGDGGGDDSRRAREEPAARGRDGGDDGRRQREEPAAEGEQPFPARVIHSVPEYGQSDDGGAGWASEPDDGDDAFGERIMGDTELLVNLKGRERACLDNMEMYRASMKAHPAIAGKIARTLKSERTELGIIQADILAAEARLEGRAEGSSRSLMPDADDVEVSRLGREAARLSKDMASILNQIGAYKQELSDLPEDSATGDITEILSALELELSSLGETSLTVDEELIAARSRVLVRRFEESRAELGSELYDSAMDVAVHPEQVTAAEERIVERKLQQQRGMEGGDSAGIVNLLREFKAMQNVVRELQQSPAAAGGRRWTGTRLEAMRSRPGLYKAWLRASLADGSLHPACCDDAPEQLREIDGRQQQQYDV